MAVEAVRCASCGEAHHAAAACPAPTVEHATLATRPCNCLPAPPDGWRACAHCGLPQAPDKAFCGFCGHRWLPVVPS